MKKQLLHIFRNTPFGREVLMQSVYFCRHTDTLLRVYIPRFRQFLMYFQHEIATIDLDKSFLRDPDTAREHAEQIITAGGLKPSFITPRRHTASTLPDIPVDFDYMTCPRSISDLSTKISLGHLGPKVRVIIRNAHFPVLIPTPVYKQWNSVTVFFGGSHNARKAMQVGAELARVTGMPLYVFTQAEGRSRRDYEQILKDGGFSDLVAEKRFEWLFFEKGKFKVNLYHVPHDSLVVVGAYGHGVIKEVLFGSVMEEIQTILPNNMLIVGPEVSL